MFSGIIKTIGKIEKKQPYRGGFLYTISGVSADPGASVAIDGVCLTAQTSQQDQTSFELLEVTLQKTTLGEKEVGDAVHVEPALRVGDSLGGHFVYGHVDGVGTVDAIDGSVVRVALPAELMHYCVPQGSVALNGVSLTIARRTDTYIEVSLIKETCDRTTFSDISVGDTLNIECDMLVKVVRQHVNALVNQ